MPGRRGSILKRPSVTTMPEESTTGAHVAGPNTTSLPSIAHVNDAFQNDDESENQNEQHAAHNRRRRYGTTDTVAVDAKKPPSLPTVVTEAPSRKISTNPSGSDTGQSQQPTDSVQTTLSDTSRKISLSASPMNVDSVSDGGTGESRSPSRKVSISPSPPHISQSDVWVERKISTTSGMMGPPKSILVNGDSSPNFDGKFFESYRGPPSEQRDPITDSWWFALCTKCRQKETGPGWEPNFWQSFCPYPFCPTYRHFSRIAGLFILGFLAWGILYSIAGEDAGPGGQLFNIALLCIVSNFGGWLVRLVSMPPLVGMLLTGILWQNLGLINIHGGYTTLTAILRKIALVIILIRAGLDLEVDVMRRMLWTVLRLGLIPWITECIAIAILSTYVLGLPLMWGFLLGSIIAAVSPAVVVPGLIRYRNKGYGVAKGIPTIVIAVSGIDDAVSVAGYGIISSLLFGSNSLVFDILLAPISIISGLLFGVLWGLLSYYVPEKEDPFVVPLRLLLLLGGGLIAVFGSEHLGYDGAGPLGCAAAGFFSIVAYTKTGWEVEDNPVATGFEIFWMIFEPILFGLTGTQIKFDEMDGIFVGKAIGIIVLAIVIRVFVTVISGTFTILNTKEKIFCGLAWMSKASVQAALAPVAYDTVKDWSGDYPEYAKTVLLTCILSIILTAPAGAIIIALFGKKFLTKTEEAQPPPDGWRRSARPSLRDITIHNDGDDLSMGQRSKRSSVVNNAVGGAGAGGVP